MKHELDGRSFRGEVGLKGKVRGDRDRLVFARGRFLSTACEEYGFHWAPYKETRARGVLTFTARPKNRDADTLTWRGEIRGDRIEGVAVHRGREEKSGPIVPTEFWFRGKEVHESALRPRRPVTLRKAA